MFRRRDRISLQQRKRLNKKRQRRGILFLVLEFLILAVLVLAAFMMYKLDHLTIIHWMRAAWNYMRHRRDTRMWHCSGWIPETES